MSHSTALQAFGLSKTFWIPQEPHTTMKERIAHLLRPNPVEKLQAVRSVSFEVEKGEFFGIVGRNGSGKSTLLKILSGIYTPDTGYVRTHGRISPFLELGVGFDPELSARENIYLNSIILGMKREEVDEKFQSMIDFAGLSHFVDQKLKKFSTGMQMRLAFSVAVQSVADILIFDEVLAVGDSAFQQKCREVFTALKKQGKTIILVSHNAGDIEQFCDRAMLIEHGEMILLGDPKTVMHRYQGILDREGILV